jgi:RNA polymerase sigma-70 factor (ECF subfamily)
MGTSTLKRIFGFDGSLAWPVSQNHQTSFGNPTHTTQRILSSEQEFIAQIRSTQGILWKICHLYCPEAEERQDLFQEMLVQLWRSYRTFKGQSKFSTWVYRVCLNVAISQYRKSRRQAPSTELPREVYEQVDSQESELKEERSKALYEAIAQLKTLEKALVMLYLEDKSYDEISEIMGISANNARVKMNRIREKLRTLMVKKST